MLIYIDSHLSNICIQIYNMTHCHIQTLNIESLFYDYFSPYRQEKNVSLINVPQMFTNTLITGTR